MAQHNIRILSFLNIFFTTNLKNDTLTHTLFCLTDTGVNNSHNCELYKSVNLTVPDKLSLYEHSVRLLRKQGNLSKNGHLR